MDILATITAGKTLIEIAILTSGLLKEAQSTPNLVRRVVLYLTAAQASVRALGAERQGILSDVRACDVGNPSQVDTLWRRLDKYLHEDIIRPTLSDAIDGLRACRTPITIEAEGSWFRTHDKLAAVETFSQTLEQLSSLLYALSVNFYPGGSGTGIQTLLPIYELLTKVRQKQQAHQFQDSKIDATSEKLGQLALKALRDESQIAWMKTTGEVEVLIAELQLAFNVHLIQS